MNPVVSSLALRIIFWKDNRGQDLVEYALITGFVALAAGATFPEISGSISTIFAKVNKTLFAAASGIRTDNGL